MESNLATSLVITAVSGGRLMVFAGGLAAALSCAAAQSGSRKKRKQVSRENRNGFIGAGPLRVLKLLLICNCEVLYAIHRGLLLKSLKALWANPRPEYTLGNLVNGYHAAKDARGGEGLGVYRGTGR